MNHLRNHFVDFLGITSSRLLLLSRSPIEHELAVSRGL